MFDVMQGLYEIYKFLIYLCFDNCYFLDEYYYQVGDIVIVIVVIVFELVFVIVDMDKGQKYKVFNVSKIEVYYVIILMIKSGVGIQFNEKEWNVYNLVFVYFIGLFYLDVICNKMKIYFDIKGDIFMVIQSVLV